MGSIKGPIGGGAVPSGLSGNGPTGPKKGRVVAGEFFGGGVDEEGNGDVESGGLGGGDVSGRVGVVGEGFGGEEMMGGGREGLGPRRRGGGEGVFTGGSVSEGSEGGGGEIFITGGGSGSEGSEEGGGDGLAGMKGNDGEPEGAEAVGDGGDSTGGGGGDSTGGDGGDSTGGGGGGGEAVRAKRGGGRGDRGGAGGDDEAGGEFAGDGEAEGESNMKTKPFSGNFCEVVTFTAQRGEEGGGSR